MIAELGIKLEHELAKDNPSERYTELLKRIKENRLRQEFNRLKQLLQEHQDDSNEWLNIQNEKFKIEKEIHRLRTP